MRAHPIIVLLCLAGPSLAAVSRAQEPVSDSIAFRRGQWGTEFSIGGGFAAAGLLRFRGPARALFVDVAAAYDHASMSNGTTNGGVDATFVRLRLGTRGYRPIGRHLQRHVTVGVSVTQSWQKATQAAAQNTSWGLGAGLFGDIGATWLVTPHLGLGARFGGAVTYAHSEASGGGGTTSSDRFSVSLGSVALAGQLYF